MTVDKGKGEGRGTLAADKHGQKYHEPLTDEEEKASPGGGSVYRGGLYEHGEVPTPSPKRIKGFLPAEPPKRRCHQCGKEVANFYKGTREFLCISCRDQQGLSAGSFRRDPQRSANIYQPPP